jgi:hypothetical protein
MGANFSCCLWTEWNRREERAVQRFQFYERTQHKIHFSLIMEDRKTFKKNALLCNVCFSFLCIFCSEHFSHPWIFSVLLSRFARHDSQSRERVNYGHGSWGTRNQQWLCWRGPAAIYPTDLPTVNCTREWYGTITCHEFRPWCWRHGLNFLL